MAEYGALSDPAHSQWEAIDLGIGHEDPPHIQSMPLTDEFRGGFFAVRFNPDSYLSDELSPSELELT